MEQSLPSLPPARATHVEHRERRVFLELASGTYILEVSFQILANAARADRNRAGSARHVSLLLAMRFPSLTNFANTFYACLHKHQPNITPAAAARLLHPGEIMKAIHAIQKAMELDLPGSSSTLWRGLAR